MVTTMIGKAPRTSPSASKNVDHALAHLRLRFGMLIPISLKVKFELVKAASNRGTNVCGSVKEARREWRRLSSA